jgi:diguanylate cyclase (GGDEF)-like protein
MDEMPPGGRVVFVCEEAVADSDLVHAVHELNPETRLVTAGGLLSRLAALDPDTIVVELDDQKPEFLEQLGSKILPKTRLIGVGDLRATAQGAHAFPFDCVLFSDPDPETLRAALDGSPPTNLGRIVDELLTLSMLGGELPATLVDVCVRATRAFDADDCILIMTNESTCYTARSISEEVLQALVPICETVCALGTTLITTQHSQHPYRTFLGVPLTHDNAPAVAHLLLCRTDSVPFDKDARRHVRNFAGRIATDLSWRLVQERLLADREKGHDVPRVDPVLGVANRTALDEALPQLVAASERVGEPFSVAIIDVDGLRLINERRGYPAGDAVLTHIAQVASKNTRDVDLVARYSGDAVAVVLPGVNAAGAMQTLTQILSEIDAAPVLHEGKEVNLTVSAGIAELQYDEETGDVALSRAMAARRGARLHGEVIAAADAEIIADAPAQADFSIGATLGGVYQIRHEISRGAFGVVYRAEDMALARQVALKLLRSDLAADTAFVERFRTEAATLARIRNPNLVQVYAFGVDGANVFFAMELVEGQALDERIESARRRMRHLPLPEVVSTIDQVAHALDAVHQAGMLHRDVKPENVLIDRVHRRCVLVDVGIAVRLGSDKNPAGTPGFTAPEVFGAAGESPATDVYSLAALAYLLLTLQPPFRGPGALEILGMQMSRPTPLTEIRRDLPKGIDAVVLPALDPDPTVRPQSARAFAKGLSEVIARATGGAEGRNAPRMTLEPPMRKSGPIMSLSNASLRVPPVAADPLRRSSRNSTPTEKSTRGILFRSVYEILGARRGSAWIAEVKRNVPELAVALGPQSTALAWHPTSAFVSVLESLSKDDRECRTVAMQLGRAAATSSFAQFYGADTKGVTPAQALGVADMLWHCYHNWGATVVKAQELHAEVTINDGITSALLCSSTSGLLAGLIGQAGGRGITVGHRTCAAEGASTCLFELSWQAPTLTSAPR